MAVSKQPTITPETSSGEGLDEEPSSRGEAKWKRFHPFRVVRKIFRRRIKREGTNVVSDASKKSWSTSELQSVQDDGAGKCEVTSPLKIGLSVSHDSIFSPENNSNIVNNEALDVPHGSSLSVRHTSMKNMFKDELFTRIRARRDSDDDGIGMQNSPYSSPTTIDVLNQGFKEKLPKSQTTCSAGSLISMGSSENDEDSTGQSSGHSSRMSLIDRRSLDSEADSEVANPVPLNHNAAHHKIAVRPKRNYGLPRRRVKQVAATKVASLPSTPEVTEDLSKTIQQLGVSERITSTHEYSIMSEKAIISTSISSTEKLTTSRSATMSYSEVSQHISETHVREKVISETQHQKEKVFPESSSQAKSNIDDDAIWINSHSDSKQETFSPVSDDLNHTDENNMENISQIMQKTANAFESSKQSLVSKDENSEMESYKLVKSTLQEKSKCDTMFDDYLASTSDSPISVSSLVKSIEKSDSFKSAEKNKKLVEDIKYTEQHESIEKKYDKEFEDDLKFGEETKPSKQNTPNNEEFPESTNLSSPKEMKMLSPADCVNEIYKRATVSEKLDIDSEFILKPLKKDRKFSGENDPPHTDVVSENKSDSSLVSSVYLEEESIMSEKYLSTGMEESRIFVSHHTSFTDDLKDILVTEAHNYAAVDEKSEISIQSGEDAISSKGKDICDPYISSIGISTSIHSEADVTYTSSSAFCDKKMSEDKITISVNSNSDNVKSNSISLQNDSGMSRTSLQKSLLSNNESDVNQKVPEKQLKSPQKSHLPDISSSIKNTTSQKRVSVEIVPFSQRMKERKYQPISFTNKECSSENKKNSSALVERKLSDRKISKNKDLDKSNNRHSFSGTVNADNKKDGDLVNSKKETKNEKLQYPVQIRIHKSKPEIKDKNAITMNASSEFKSSNKDTSEVKFHMHSAKASQTEGKLSKEDNKSLENTPKWEIKIQPAASHAAVSQMSNSEENTSSSVLSQRNFILKSESFKSSQFTGNENRDLSPDIDFSVTKNQDSNMKSSKDSSVVSDDPEPELLRVFARRSIKQKHCDKGKTDETEKQSNVTPHTTPVVELTEKNKDMISISLNSTVIKIAEISKPHITKPDLKKKSKSFCEKEKVVPRSVSPLKEMNLIQRDSPARSSVDSLISSENLHPRQRIANLDDAPLTLPPESEKKIGNKSAQIESIVENTLTSKEEQSHKLNSISTPPPSTSVNGNLSNIGMVKENQDMIAGKDAHTPAWLQLAQQRRELREQRERLLLGGSSNSFMDGSSKPSRSSKVWDMVNNFQKLQMT